MRLTVDINGSPQHTKKIPFTLHVDRLHHIFSQHFKKQPLAPSYLKDPFSPNRVDVVRTHLPFYIFDLKAENIRVAEDSKNSKNLKNSEKAQKVLTFGMGFSEEKMHIFAGDYAKYTPKELLTFKINKADENVLALAEQTTQKENANKVLLLEEDGMKVAFSRFVEMLKGFVQSEFGEGDKGKEAEITANISLKFSCYYAPVYVLLFGHFGTTNRVVINGVTGESTGPLILSFLRITVLSAGSILGGTAFFSPNINTLYDVMEQSLLILPFAASFALMALFACTHREFNRKFKSPEINYKTFFQMARENEKRVFYQNWLMHQNQKESEYHRWFRQNSFEDFRRRMQKQGVNYRARHVFGEDAHYENPDASKKNDRVVSPRQLYTVLGVSASSSRLEIERAFKGIALKWHPDKFSHKKAEEQRFAEMRFNDAMAAYNVLRDDCKRRQYDLTGDTD